MNELSLCMIVKNEEEKLSKCLNSVKSICDEIVIVDTGSTDKTVELARQFGAKIIEKSWADSFSYARNISLSNATKPWIMWLDADDIVPEESVLKIKRIKDEFKLDSAFGFQIKNTTDGVMGDIFNQIRMFPNNSEIRFKYRVHEQVLPSIQKLNLKVFYTDVIVFHSGYHSAEAKIRKQKRNIVLLKKDIEENDNPVMLFTYAGTLVDLGRDEESYVYYEQAYLTAKEQNTERHIMEEVPLVLAEKFLRKKDYSACDKWIKIASENTPDHIKLHFLNGKIAEAKNQYQEALDAFEKVLASPEKSSFIPINYKLLKIQACGSLGRLYGTIFPNKERMIEILEYAKKLQK